MSFGIRFALWLSKRLGNPRVIYGGSGTDKYLSRYYLFGRPHMADGSDPFDAHGDPKDGIQWSKLPFGIYLHRFHRSDEDRELHNHPWRWAVSLILSGGYVEERKANMPKGWPLVFQRTRKRVFVPGDINRITSNDFHRVELLDSCQVHAADGSCEVGFEHTWTLFVVGPKFQGWGFWNKSTEKFTPWRAFLQSKRGRSVDAE